MCKMGDKRSKCMAINLTSAISTNGSQGRSIQPQPQHLKVHKKTVMGLNPELVNIVQIILNVHIALLMGGLPRG